MHVLDEDRLALQQAIYDDDLATILPIVKEKCDDVARIIVVKRRHSFDLVEFTWIFKSTNNEIQLRHTFSETVNHDSK